VDGSRTWAIYEIQGAGASNKNVESGPLERRSILVLMRSGSIFIVIITMPMPVNSTTHEQVA